MTLLASSTAQAEEFRIEFSPSLNSNVRKRLGQFMTPQKIALLLAEHFKELPQDIRLLDAGAGMGALTSAFVEAACRRNPPPRSIHVTCYEVDTALADLLTKTLEACRSSCESAGVQFEANLVRDDYILSSTEPLLSEVGRFNCAILNPPYGKINSSSKWRHALRQQGIETVNLYAAFVALAVQQLTAGGQLVAITPRSFCNGSYYEPFRRLVLESSSLKSLYVFESRRTAFSDDEVLQENIIFHIKKASPQGPVLISTDVSPATEVDFSKVVRPDDPHAFIRLPMTDEADVDIVQMLPCSLAELGLSVSTGRVVDFRIREYLLKESTDNSVPLIYPGHFDNGTVCWPKAEFKKANAIVDCPETESQINPAGTYVLTKRFSAKEEKRRLVAAVYSGNRAGFENHLNYFHRNGQGLTAAIAKGLCRYLNSELVDIHFRTFSGHTQVNATDLRNLRYPTLDQLTELASAEDVDKLIAEYADYSSTL